MSDEEEHSESEFHCPEVFEFHDLDDFTAINCKQIGGRENEGTAGKNRQ